MTKYAILTLSLAMLAACASTQDAMTQDETIDPLTGQTFSLEVSSSTLGDSGVMPDETVFDGFGCTGQNLSPELTWSEGPEGTKSYLVMLYDPDAPTAVGFHHWWVANLPSTTRSLPERFGTTPADQLDTGVVQGRTDYGIEGYGGPCPPEGRTHRYRFYVWALGVDALPVDAQTSPTVVRFMVNQHALAVGRLEATYGR